MQNAADADADARLPARIRAALALVPYLQTDAHSRDAMRWIVRCVPATDATRRFRMTAGYLAERLGCSERTAKRRLRELESAGWIARDQPKRGARRHGFRAAWTWLTDAALQALGLVLQRGPEPARNPKPCSKGEAAPRAHRVPDDLAPLAERITPRRVVWLMARCRAAGRRLQEFAAQALQADSPAGFVLRALRARGHSTGGFAQYPPAAGGDCRQDASAYLDACEKAGARTEAGRLAGLQMLRALRR